MFCILYTFFLELLASRPGADNPTRFGLITSGYRSKIEGSPEILITPKYDRVLSQMVYAPPVFRFTYNRCVQHWILYSLANEQILST